MLRHQYHIRSTPKASVVDGCRNQHNVATSKQAEVKCIRNNLKIFFLFNDSGLGKQLGVMIFNDYFLLRY
jgi:hypothetical protein